MSRQFRECYSDLSGLIPCPVLGSIILLFIPNSRIRLIRFIGPCVSLLTFLYSLVLRMQSDSSTAEFQFVGTIRWLPHENINLYMGPDGISSFFVVLTTFLIPICILVGWSSIESYGKEYVIVFPICEFLMIAVSRMPDLLLLHVLLESVLIPMFSGDRFRIQNQVPSGISPPFHVPEMDLVKYSTFPMIIPLSGIRGIFPNRRNITIMSMSIESMLPAVNSNPLVFPVYPDDMMGQSFALSVLTVAAAESAIGLAIPVITFRIRGTIAVESINRMKGQHELPTI